MKTKLSFPFATTSNIFYLIPLMLLWTSLSQVSIFSIIFLFLTSTAFHMYKTKIFSRLDLIAACIVLLLCIEYAISSQTDFIYTFLAVVAILIGLYIRKYKEDGSRNDYSHGLWHLCAAIAITLAYWPK